MKFLLGSFLVVIVVACPIARAQSCAGDCNGDHAVAVDDLITMVSVGLGLTSVTECEPGDTDHSRDITIEEILVAVSISLNGCIGPEASPTHTSPPTPTPTPTSRPSGIATPTPTTTPLFSLGCCDNLTNIPVPILCAQLPQQQCETLFGGTWKPALNCVVTQGCLESTPTRTPTPTPMPTLTPTATPPLILGCCDEGLICHQVTQQQCEQVYQGTWKAAEVCTVIGRLPACRPIETPPATSTPQPTHTPSGCCKTSTGCTQLASQQQCTALAGQWNPGKVCQGGSQCSGGER